MAILATTDTDRILSLFKINEAWWPALHFDNYFQMQELLTHLSIDGFAEVRNRSFIEQLKRGRRGSPQNVINAPVAILLGTKKDIIWDEDIPESKSLMIHVSEIMSSTDKALQDALEDALNFIEKFEEHKGQGDCSHESGSTTSQPPQATAVEAVALEDSRDASIDKDRSSKGRRNSTTEKSRNSIVPVSTTFSRGKKGYSGNDSNLGTQSQGVVSANKRKEVAVAEDETVVSNMTNVVTLEDTGFSSATEKRKVKAKNKMTRKVQFREAETEDDEYSIPDIKVVMKILKLIGYKSSGNYWFRPGVPTKAKNKDKLGIEFFEGLPQLRRFLCLYGVEYKGYTKIDDKKSDVLEKWIRYSICPSLRECKEIPNEARDALSSPYNLLMKLGFRYLGAEYFEPGVTPKKLGGIAVNGFPLDGVQGLIAKLCRTGLPENCKKINEMDRLRLELFISSCKDVDTFKFENAPFRVPPVDSKSKDDDSSSHAESEANKDKGKRGRTKKLEAEDAQRVTSVALPKETEAVTSPSESDEDSELGSKVLFQEEVLLLPTPEIQKNNLVSISSPIDHISVTGESVSATVVSTTSDGCDKNVPIDSPDLESKTTDDVALSTQDQAIASDNKEDIPFYTQEQATTEVENEEHHSKSGAGTGHEVMDTLVLESEVMGDVAVDTREQVPTSDTYCDSEKFVDPPLPYEDVIEKSQGKELEMMLTQENCGENESEDLSCADKFSPSCFDSSISHASSETSPQKVRKLVQEFDKSASQEEIMTQVEEAFPTCDSATLQNVKNAAADDNLSTSSERTGDQKKEEWCQKLAALLKPDHLWAEVRNNMLELGMIYRTGHGLNDFEYIIPGGKSSRENGKRHVDYFVEEYDMKVFAVNNFGWKGDNMYKKEVEERKRANLRRRAGSTSEEEFSLPPSANIDNDDYKKWCQLTADIIEPNDLYVEVRNKMLATSDTPNGTEFGMKFVQGRDISPDEFVFPGRKSSRENGKRQIDYLVDDFDFRLFAFENFGWKGDDVFNQEQEWRRTANTTDGISPTRRSKRMSPTISDSSPRPRRRAGSKTEKEVSLQPSANIDIDDYKKWRQLTADIIKPNDLYVEVRNKMLATSDTPNGTEFGMKFVQGRDISPDEFVFPGRKSSRENGKRQIDYLVDDFDFRLFAFENFGWKGDDVFNQEQERRSTANTTDGISPTRRSKRMSPTISDSSPPKKKQRNNSLSKKETNTLTTPEKKKDVGEKLLSCKRVLQNAPRRGKLSIVGSAGESKFKKQVNAIQNFLTTAISGTGSNILYVCGSPGVGKSSAVDWSCSQAKKQVKAGNFKDFKIFSHGVIKSTSSNDDRVFLNNLFDVLGLETNRSLSIQGLRKHLVKKKETFVTLIIDEVDNIVNTTKAGDTSLNKTESLLGELCRVANDPDYPFSLIGIANSISSNETRRLRDIGMMDGDKIAFAPYNSCDLITLVVDRIGDSIVDVKALEYASKKVANSRGDAREMFDLVTKAADECLKTEHYSNEVKEGRKPAVTIRHMMKAIKSTIPEYADRINNLPEVAKTCLCVAVTISKTCSSTPFTFRYLRKYCSEAARQLMSTDIDVDQFMTLFQNLIDQGLLTFGSDEAHDVNGLGPEVLLGKPVHFGLQLQEVESAIEDLMDEKPFYGKLEKHIKENPPAGDFAHYMGE